MITLKQKLPYCLLSHPDLLLCDVSKLIVGAVQSPSIWQWSGVHIELWVNVLNKDTLNHIVWWSVLV